jgi:hypothetical protein
MLSCYKKKYDLILKCLLYQIYQNLNMIAGWSSLVARRAHNPKVGGSNPSPATNDRPVLIGGFFVCGMMGKFGC